ncbi:mucin-2-like [Mercenaria mercenaria]|uniref:mucin-2-like n=1 Tax=Mercenaria mercenaria TaxID=6596 RepID=UPI001E1DC725|nr:mucin-2-like [Mercenaria mercenaria]
MCKLGFIFLLLGLLTRFSLGAKGSSNCGTNQWQCSDGSCIFLVARCDNFPDCTDKSDEQGCVSVVCNEGQRPCTSGECIDANRFCDGVIHCKDAGDELAADCRGIIRTTTPMYNAKNYTAITEPNSTVSSKTTVFSLDPLPNQQTSLTALPSTTTYPVTRPNWRKLFTMKPADKPTTLPAPPSPTTLPAPHPPLIFVPIETHRKTELPKWPTWPQQITRKFGHMTPARTSMETTTMRSTTPYWYNWYNTTYQPTTSRTPCVEVEDRFEFCRRRYRGYFRHPNDCKQYIVCEWGFMHICTCPNDTHWDLRIIACVWEYTSPCITGQYDKPIIPDQTTRVVTSSSAITPSKSSIATTTSHSATTTITPSHTTTTEFVPPPIRLRALPATPAWLKELTEKTFLKPHEPPPPRYQSLLTRFFKAIPQDGVTQSIRLNK